MPVRIASQGEPGRPWSHLQPVLDAEQDWGNSTRDGFRYIPQNGGWFAFMRRPLNIEGLRAAFEFPEHITCGRQDDGDTWLVDTANDVRIDAVNPHRRLGPPRPPPHRPAPQAVRAMTARCRLRTSTDPS